MSTMIRTGIGPQQLRNLWSAIGDPSAAQRTRCRVWGALVAVLTALVAGVPVARAEDGATLSALEIAYGREMNAHAHRLAFAAAAERDGHCEAAALFRASASAESIHAERLGAAIRQFDARPSWTLASVTVRGTADNLKACFERERDERERIYARFATYAREECLYDAAAVLEDVRLAGGTEVALFEGALARLEREEAPAVIAMASAQPIDLVPVENCAATYTLCPGDGSLFTGPIARRCPNCGTRGSCAIVLSSVSGGGLGAIREGAGLVAAR